MYLNVLTNEQLNLLPALKVFSDKFYLVGGTALALQIGHRRSIDFDLFTHGEISPQSIRKKLEKFFPRLAKIYEDESEYTILVNNVKITFYGYPFDIPKDMWLKDIIPMPNVLTLSAMKAFALGHRAKWKDYIDLYFVFKIHSFDNVCAHAKKLFKDEFNERLFRSQISYYDDINSDEEIEFMPGFETSKEKIKTTLTKISTQL